jgi:hypothetical protein
MGVAGYTATEKCFRKILVYAGDVGVEMVQYIVPVLTVMHTGKVLFGRVKVVKAFPSAFDTDIDRTLRKRYSELKDTIGSFAFGAA